MWQTVKSARRETGAAFLVTTHYIDEVAEHLSNVSVINHGTVVANGSPAHIREMFATGEVTLGVAEDTVDSAVDVLAGTAFEAHPTETVPGIVVRSRHPDVDAAKIITILAGHGISVDSISVREATLEEAFLTITGSRDPERQIP